MPTKGQLLHTQEMQWMPATALYGESVFHEGQPLVWYKLLTDRRVEGKGVTYLSKFCPPEGKLLKIIAKARSDEHVYILEGGFCDVTGKQRVFAGDYAFNPEGHPHGLFLGVETIAIQFYGGEPDEIVELSVIEPRRTR